jgi:hypothetical protein
MNIDEILAHEIYLSRLATGGMNSIIFPSLADAYKSVNAILREYDEIKTIAQATAISKAVTQAVQEASGWGALTAQLTQTAVYDAGFYASLIGAAAVTPSDAKVEQLAKRTMMSLSSGKQFDTGLWPTFVAGNLDAQSEIINNVITTGFARGTPVRQLRKQIQVAFDGIIPRQAEALGRTAYNHFSTVGRRALVNANPELITREIPIVAFDSRTTDICISVAARFGTKGWPAGESPVGYPPYHIGCRTTIVPMAKGQTLTGTRSSVGGRDGEAAEAAFDKRDAARRTASQVRYRGRRDANIFSPGQIPAGTPIESFLRDQPDWFVDDTLGPRRAALFRSGKLKLRNLTDASLRPLTLDQIAGRERG